MTSTSRSVDAPDVEVSIEIEHSTLCYRRRRYVSDDDHLRRSDLGSGRCVEALRRKQLDVNALYETRGRYTFSGRFSVVTLTFAILPNLPGFLAT